MKLNDYVYKGLLKEPPMKIDLRYYTWDFPYVDEFPNCCAINVLNDFRIDEIRKKDNPGIYWTHSDIILGDEENLYSNKEALSVVVTYVHECIKRDCLPNNRKRGPYLLVALNAAQIAKGWSDVLEEYFGFYPLEDDFRNANNYNKTSRIRLLGLCFTDFCDSK